MLSKIAWGILAVVVLALLYVFIGLPLLEFSQKIDYFPNNEDHSLISLFSAFLIILTFFLVVATVALAVVAHLQITSAREQLKHIGDSARADFLMRLDNRYGSEEIIKARQIIHVLYLESKHIKRKGDEAEDIHRNYIAEKINEYASDPRKVNEYVYLLNLLDFLETMSFFANKGIVRKEEIVDLIGLSLNFFWDVFKTRVRARRQKYNDSRYIEFENLVKASRSDISQQGPQKNF